MSLRDSLGQEVTISHGPKGTRAEVIRGYLKEIRHGDPGDEFLRRRPSAGDSVLLGGYPPADITLTIVPMQTFAGEHPHCKNKIKKTKKEKDIMENNPFTIHHDEIRKAVVVYKKGPDSPDGKEQYYDASGELRAREKLEEMPFFARFDAAEFGQMMNAARNSSAFDLTRDCFR
jgi:hypothetical protein